MSALSNFAKEIQGMRQNYDVNHPVVANIIKAKEERLKLLIELNKEHEEKFGPLIPKLVNEHSKEKQKEIKKKKKRDKNVIQTSLRRSLRIQNSPKTEYNESESVVMDENKAPIERLPNIYGPVPGVAVGCHWETRLECSRYGVHKPTVAGIHPGPDGAYSIALSGGYPEDVDDGISFLYTGAGGRDLKGTSSNPKNLRTAPQTKDQELEGSNLSLVRSIETKQPIRVIRGYKSPSIFAPETGYRYDGLYQAVKYWEDVGKTGYRVYRFRLERIENQAPPPWERLSSTNILPINGKEKFDNVNETLLLKKESNSQEKNKTSDSPKDIQSETDYCDDENSLKDVHIDSDCTKVNIVVQVNGQKPQTFCSPNVVKEVDHQIQRCISFFFKFEYDENKVLREDLCEENFKGWD